MLILAVVPPCARECRPVRVTGVLIFANSWICVACVLPAAGPLGHRADARLRTGGLARDSKTSCRDSHRQVGRPVAPSAIAGMTLRNEQSVRLTPQTTLPTRLSRTVRCSVRHGAHISHSVRSPSYGSEGCDGPADHRLLAGLARRSPYAVLGTKRPPVQSGHPVEVPTRQLVLSSAP